MPEDQDHWVETGDYRISVTECQPTVLAGGARGARTLLFVHGRFGDSGIWRPLVGRLAPRFRCLRLDLPGFGRSTCRHSRGCSILEQAELVRAVSERFVTGGGQVVLIGHDLGGAIAQLCALRASLPLAALVLISPAALVGEAAHLKTGWLGLRARRSLRRLLRAAGDIDDEWRDGLCSPWSERGTRSALRRAFEAWEISWPHIEERDRWRAQLERLPYPTLLLCGKRDELGSAEAAAELMHCLPDADLFESDECGHWPSLERVDWVHIKMQEFLFKTARQGRRDSVFLG